MLKKAFVLITLPFFSLIAKAQPDSIVAAQYMAQANNCIERNQADSARMFHQAALGIFKKNNRLDLWIDSYITVSFGWADIMQRPIEALDILEQTHSQAWRKPENLKEWEQVIRVQMYKGHFYQYYIFDYPNAIKYYEESFQLFVRQLGEENDKIANYIYHQLGNLYTRLGDYSRAEALLQRGITYGQQHNKPEIGRYGDLAIALIDLGKNKEALDVISQGLKVPNATLGTRITARLSEARAWLNLGNLFAALKSLNAVSTLVAQLPSEEEQAYYLAGYHAVAATVQDALGNNAAALRHFQDVIKNEAIAQRTTFCREVAKAHSALGDFFLRQKKVAAALHEYQLALQCVLKTFNPTKDDQNPEAAIFITENAIIEALLGKAKAFFALGRLENALACYELIPVVEAKLRATHAYESSSLLALSESRIRFDQSISIAWLLYERSNGNRSFADRAFRLTEQARGMLLLQSLAQAQANYQLPEPVRRRESGLKVKLAWYEHEIATEEENGTEGNAQRLAQLKKELFDLKQEDEKFKAELRQNFPDYAALSDEIQFLESGGVPSLLREGQALIDYYLTADEAYVFAFDKKGNFSWRKAALPSGFREAVAQFADYLAKGNEEDKDGASNFRKHASIWYELLLAPELKRMMPQSGSLVIIPDDALVFVPFEVLLRQPAPTGNWRDLPWLLADYNTGYAYSATLLKMQQVISDKHRERKEATRYVFGGFAPSYSATGLYKLTSTESMVNSAQKLLGGKTWCGAQANEARFKDIAPQCRLLLLAMHGLADAENPELSRLLFGDPLPDSLENDNVLYASELQIMQLQADLAVLSACHSGFGKLQKGEGVFSLARAFARAGVPATIMSMWLLHENTAGPLVQAFLQYLQAGKTKDEALRLAKLDFLKNDQNFEMSHPFYWGGVLASGDMCTLDIQRKTLGWWWLAIGIAALAGAWLVFQKTRQQSNRAV